MPNPSISVAGTQWGANGAGQLTCGVNPVGVGDLMVLTFETFGVPGATAVSGGGVASWSQASSYYDSSGTFGVTISQSIWWGVVTTTGLSTITVTDAALGSNFSTLWAREFTASGASWALVTESPPAGTTGGVPPTSGNNPSYPGLTDSAGGNDLYVGASASYFGHMSAGSTSGFVYEVAGGNNSCQACYDTSVSGTVQPNSVNSDSGSSLLIGAIFTAGGGGGGGTAHTATGSLTVTPVLSASRARGKFRAGALAVVPSLSASRTRGKFRGGSLTVSPAFSASRVHGHSRGGSLLVVPSFAAARRVAHVRSGSLLVTPVFRGLASGGMVTVPSKGSWWGLHSVFEESRQEYDAYWTRPPLDCPICAQPLVNAPSAKSGTGVELFCNYAGDHTFRWPRDRQQPTRLDAGALGGSGW